MHRDDYLKLSPDELLRSCTLKGFQGAGPGGQHRNKTNTGVILRLEVFNLEIKACESRSAAENKVHALHRMRLALALKVREEPPKIPMKFPGSCGHVKPSNYGFAPFVAQVLDIVAANSGDTKPAASAFGLSATALTKILYQEKAVVEAVQALRVGRGKPPLKR